jgi:hypothetical protein
VHAREWVPPDALVSLAADLLEAFQGGTGLAYGGSRFSAADVRAVLDGVGLFLLPCANPDGRQHSQAVDPMWRKNRRPHPSGGDCIGVDLNRNFDFLWDHTAKFSSGSGVNTSANPCNRNVYRGPAAGSEPETRNVTWLLDTYPEIQWHIDVHSAIPAILYNWGSDENQTQDTEQTFLNPAFDALRGVPGDDAYREYISASDLDVATSLSSAMDYGVEQAFGLYPTSGASDDYAFARHFADHARRKVYGFTIECGRSFQPSWAEAESVIADVSSGLIAFCLQVGALLPEQDAVR